MARLTKAERQTLVLQGELGAAQGELAQTRADLHQALEQNKDLYADREAWRHRAMSAYDALAETRQMLERERASRAVKAS